VSPDGNYVFVAAHDSGSLAVLDVTTKRNPVVVGAVNGFSSPYVVAVSLDGQYVFLPLLGLDSLVVVNVTTVSNPVVIGSVVNSIHMDGAFDVVVSFDGGYASVSGLLSDSIARWWTFPTRPAPRWWVVSLAARTVYGHAPYGVAFVVAGWKLHFRSWAYNSASIGLVDVASKTNPVVIGGVKASPHMPAAFRTVMSRDSKYDVVSTLSFYSLAVVGVCFDY
jgi:YVTN family beta-propeller protein